MVRSQLNAHLYQLDFLYQHQYGFKHGHSTEQAITRLNNWVLESMDEGKVTGVLFVNISKAFDSLNHKVLLHKLEHLGESERSLQSKQVKRSSHEWINKFIIANLVSVIISIICSSEE